MKKRLAIIVGIVSIILAASFVGTVFYVTNNDINYGIVIIDRDVPVGSNITLAYEIKNGMFAPSVSDVYLDIWVFNLNDTASSHGLLHYYSSIYGLNSRGIKDQAVISTHYLDSGEYRVYTCLFYTTDRGHCKQLEMEFEIY